MRVFKQSKWVLFKDIVGAFAGAFVAGIIAMFFTTDMRIIVPVAAAVLLIALYLAIFSDNIRFEFVNDEMSYFKKNKLVETFNVKKCNFRYEAKTGTRSGETVMLYVAREENLDKEIWIDCTPLGLSQFYAMFELIKKETNFEPEKMVATKKGEK